jgi:phosphoribosylamine--glycine ligase
MAHLSWIRDAGASGIIIFEGTSFGSVQDELRREGFHVIGGGTFGSRLEIDREFGQQCMRDAGLKTAAAHRFTNFDAAMDFVLKRPRRYVFKLNGGGFASSRNHVGELDDGRDIIAVLKQQKKSWDSREVPDFVLMDHISGVEMGVGAYFNGHDFMDAVVVDWEHKKFFNGDLGELTGEMGTLLSYDHSGPLFHATLARMKEQLRVGNYVGYINLNTIVNVDGIWPLEFTCRFGDPGYAICDALHVDNWGVLFQRMIARDRRDFRTHRGFAVGVVLSVPPFPYRDRYAQLSRGLPIFFRDDLSREDQDNIHLHEVEYRDGELIASGEMGYLMVVTGRGATASTARTNAYALAARIVVPNLRYRTDIGARFIERDCAALQKLNLWP